MGERLTKKYLKTIPHLSAMCEEVSTIASFLPGMPASSQGALLIVGVVKRPDCFLSSNFFPKGVMLFH